MLQQPIPNDTGLCRHLLHNRVVMSEFVVGVDMAIT